MSIVWEVNSEVYQLFEEVRNKHHHDRIGMAKLAISFADTKPFLKGRFNWGKVTKFSPLAKLWHPNHGKHDFLIILCADAWHSILNTLQREALADLCLTRCAVEYEPEHHVDTKGKKHVIKDDWGRIQYSANIKFDEEGNPKYRALPLDLHVFTENVIRYGPWCEEILEFGEAVQKPIAPSVGLLPAEKNTIDVLDEGQTINPAIQKFEVYETVGVVNPYWQNCGDG